MTALEEANARLEAANAELRDVDRLKTEFLSMISHELRTPLTAIIGYTDLLLRGTHGALNDRQLRDQWAVRQASQRLLDLINDLLDVSRLESGLVELDLAPLDLNEVFEAAVLAARDAAAASHLSVRVELPADLPTVLADRKRLAQILGNLLSNAIKFTPAGGRIDLSARYDGATGRVGITIADTGEGIAAEHLAHIWDRFYQADSSVRRRYGGTGLGLAIVRHLVELHGGSIRVESAGIEQGARFWFDLPAAAPLPRDERDLADGQRWRGHDTQTVLVVEDQDDNRDLIAMVLQEELGLAVLTATDGLEALAEAAKQPDLILLDLMLPRLDGFEVARRLKADPHTARIPLLALTALAQASDRENALSAGCDSVLVKPFDTDALIEAVCQQLDAARAR